MSIAQKLTAIAENVPKVYAAGEKAAAARCQAEHFVQIVPGSGTGELSFHVPFAPDFLAVAGYYPTGYMQDGVFAQIHMDMASFYYLCGLSSAYNTAGLLSTAQLQTKTTPNRYERGEDGTCRLYNLIGTNAATKATFQKDLPYVVTAVKYTDKSLRTRIERYINTLDDSGGTTMLDRAAIFSVFTEAEWEALIAEKTRGGWTFTMN